jgi:hypothetical protein
MTLPVQRRNLAPASMVQIATFVGSGSMARIPATQRTGAQDAKWMR